MEQYVRSNHDEYLRLCEAQWDLWNGVRGRERSAHCHQTQHLAINSFLQGIKRERELVKMLFEGEGIRALKMYRAYLSKLRN